MSNAGKLALVVGGLAAAVVLFLVLRPDDDESAAPTTPTGAATGTGDSTEETTSTVTVTSTVEPQEPGPVRISFENGEVTGPRRPEFTVGDRIVLIVRADVADEVHVHGYDLHKDVDAGGTVRIVFPATITGVFEAELESRGLQIVELTVE